MTYLLINTCGDEAVVALASEADGLLLEERMPGRTASEGLLAAVRRVLRGRCVEDLAGIGVVVGPGSFTGVRVGLAAAKGLCEAGRVRLIGIDRLELLGEGAVLDAGRGEYFVAGERIVRELPEEGLVTSEERVAERTGAHLVREPGGEKMLPMVLAKALRGEWSDVATVDASYVRRTDAELAVERGR